MAVTKNKRISKRDGSTASKSKTVAESKEGYKYQTIASRDINYGTYEVMGEYNSLSEARECYVDDIAAWKEKHDCLGHYGIKEICIEEVQ